MVNFINTLILFCPVHLLHLNLSEILMNLSKFQINLNLKKKTVLSFFQETNDALLWHFMWIRPNGLLTQLWFRARGFTLKPVVSNSIPGGPQLCRFSSNQLQHTCLEVACNPVDLDYLDQVCLIRVVAKLCRAVALQELSLRPMT